MCELSYATPEFQQRYRERSLRCADAFFRWVNSPEGILRTYYIMGLDKSDPDGYNGIHE